MLTKMMQEYYKKPVILLMDEYDVPVAAASSYGYYDKILEVIRVIMSSALKDNQALLFAVITGCLKITKESIFTGTNNFVSDSISSARLDEYFGFTGNDVKRLLQSADLEKYGERIQSWYDGYHFGDVDEIFSLILMPDLSVIGKIPAATVLSGRLLILQETVLPENWRL